MKESSAAISAHNSVLGGGAPVALNSFFWPSLSSIMASSISLASFLRSGEIDFGIAQPQMSSHANGSLRLGPSGKRAAAQHHLLAEDRGGRSLHEAAEGVGARFAQQGARRLLLRQLAGGPQ